jgi:PleD family two-component response regulator
MGTAVLRVLLAEDGFTDTDITLRSLCADTGQTLELFFVSTRTALPSALRDFHPDVSFLALSLLQPDPPGAVRSLHLAIPDVPLILFADPADSEVAAQCLQAGAADYILEGYMDVRTLDRVLRLALLVNQTASPLPVSRHPVTGLPDNSALLHCPEFSLYPCCLAAPRRLLAVRLANYEIIRTVAGSRAADDALRQFAGLLQKCVRRCDLVAHVAPGNFVIAIPDATVSCLASIQRRITSRVHLQNQRLLGALPLALSIHPKPWPNSPLPESQSRREAKFPSGIPARKLNPLSSDLVGSWG